MKSSKWLLLILTGLIVLSLAPGSKTQYVSADEKQYVLQLAYASAEDTVTGVTVKQAKEAIEKTSKGKIKIEIYPNAQLGADRELLEGCQAGNIALVAQATSSQISFIPALAVFDMPSIFSDMDNASKALTGEFRKKIAAEYEKAGFKLLMIAPGGFREMSCNKAIRKFEDFKGIKIRTMENPYHMAYWKALGANPTPLAFSELYIALQQGLVNAQENPYEVLIASKFVEVQKYVINTDHIMFMNTVIMNKQLYNKMPADCKKIINRCMNEASVYAVKSAIERAKAALAVIKKKGLEVIDLPATEHRKMQKAAKPVYDMIRQKVGNQLVDALLKSVKVEK
jgi:tripartite ATP-independent transporter DctP family solute receptor